jgi:hypothetical protein
MVLRLASAALERQAASARAARQGFGFMVLDEWMDGQTNPVSAGPAGTRYDPTRSLLSKM